MEWGIREVLSNRGTFPLEGDVRGIRGKDLRSWPRTRGLGNLGDLALEELTVRRSGLAGGMKEMRRGDALKGGLVPPGIHPLLRHLRDLGAPGECLEGRLRRTKGDFPGSLWKP